MGIPTNLASLARLLSANGVPPDATLRNRIINPAMTISQERLATTVDITTGSIYAVDQWVGALSTTPGGTLRLQQVASLTPGGSPNRLRATVQAADASLAAGDLYTIRQPIEGLLIADARFGTIFSRPLLLRVGVRSSVAGTFGVSIINNASNRSWIGTITIAGGEINTDLVRTLVIPGDTTGTWLTDAGVGLLLSITLASGSTFQGSPGWQAANVLTTSAQTNLMATGSATFELFDVGLYVDQTNAGIFPQWEMPAFDDELRRCQRYYEKSYEYNVLPAAAPNYVNAAAGPTQGGTLNSVVINVNFIEKRAVPIFSTFSPQLGIVGRMRDAAGTESSTASSSLAGTKSFGVVNSGSALQTNGWAYMQWVANARL